VYLLVTEDTLEEGMLNTLAAKRKTYTRTTVFSLDVTACCIASNCESLPKTPR
jgi:hypothetical protein